jgi:hypothetical protein
MNNRKIALLAIPVLAAIMIGATVAPVYAGDPTILVEIDIKPGSDPNSINTFANGVIPVALLGSAGFDASDVIFQSLKFGLCGESGASPIHRQGHVEDVNGDGFDDLVSHYRTGQTGIEFGATEACLTGQLNDGSQFVGSDAVNTVPQT